MKKTNWNPSNQNYLTSTGGSQAATASARQASRTIFKLSLCDRHILPPSQCVEMKLSWRFYVQASAVHTCPEIYF